MTKKNSKHKKAFKKALASETIDAGDFVVNRENVLQWFNLLNRAMFDDKVQLPKIRIRRLRYMGWAEGEPYQMTLRKKYVNERKMMTVIAHEMVHLLEWTENGQMCHGKFYKEWCRKFQKFSINL